MRGLAGRIKRLDVGVDGGGSEFGGGEVVELAEFGGGDGRVCELQGEAVGPIFRWGQVVTVEEVSHARIVADG